MVLIELNSQERVSIREVSGKQKFNNRLLPLPLEKRYQILIQNQFLTPFALVSLLALLAFPSYPFLVSSLEADLLETEDLEVDLLEAEDLEVDLLVTDFLETEFLEVDLLVDFLDLDLEAEDLPCLFASPLDLDLD